MVLIYDIWKCTPIILEGVNFAKDYQKDSYNNKKIIEKTINNKNIVVYNFFNENSFSHTQKTLLILKIWNFETLKNKRLFHNCLKFQSFKSHLPHINEL